MQLVEGLTSLSGAQSWSNTRMEGIRHARDGSFYAEATSIFENESKSRRSMVSEFRSTSSIRAYRCRSARSLWRLTCILASSSSDAAHRKSCHSLRTLGISKAQIIRPPGKHVNIIRAFNNTTFERQFGGDGCGSEDCDTIFSGECVSCAPKSSH